VYFNLQAGMLAMVESCRTYGMLVPARAGLPKPAFGSTDVTIGDTVDKAREKGETYFGKPPKIVFVFLPDTGKLLSALHSRFLVHEFLCCLGAGNATLAATHSLQLSAVDQTISVYTYADSYSITESNADPLWDLEERAGSGHY
jgi:hypothetical protein